jgi:hypothetical protein
MVTDQWLEMTLKASPGWVDGLIGAGRRATPLFTP